MNKRIRELAEHAELSANQGDHVDVKMMMEKFAELIVQQCISEIALISISNFENEDVAWTTKTAITNIKSHFGVDDEV